MGKATLAARGRLGQAVRRRPDDQDAIAEARRELAAAKLEDFIEQTLATAPPLSDERRRRLAALLQAGGSHA